MELDNEELEETKKMREKKCKYCDLKNGDEKDLGNGKQQLLIARHNNTFSLISQPYYEENEEIEINYCPMCR